MGSRVEILNLELQKQQVFSPCASLLCDIVSEIMKYFNTYLQLKNVKTLDISRFSHYCFIWNIYSISILLSCLEAECQHWIINYSSLPSWILWAGTTMCLPVQSLPGFLPSTLPSSFPFIFLSLLTLLSTYTHTHANMHTLAHRYFPIGDRWHWRQGVYCASLTPLAWRVPASAPLQLSPARLPINGPGRQSPSP